MVGKPHGRDEQITKLTERQFGVFSGRQAIAAGFPRSTIGSRVQGGHWTRVIGDSYRVAGRPPSWQQPVVGAYLTIGEPGAVCGPAALAMWELAQPPCEPEVLVPSRRRPRHSEIAVVRTRRWRRLDVVKLGGVQITSPMRTLLDCAPRICEEDLEVAVDTAHRKRLIEPGRFSSYLKAAATSRTPSAADLLSLVQIRTTGSAIESPAETLLFRILRRSGLPLPEVQHWVRTRHGRRRIDFAYPDHKLAIEFDSLGFHDGLRALDRDSTRDNELADIGWERRHITWNMLKNNPGEVAWTVGRALGLTPTRWKDRGA
jgi:very-short-patch-repair endonuclease